MIGEFVELNSKTYSLIVVGTKEIKKREGFNKNIFENTKHGEYIDAMFNKYLIRIYKNSKKLHTIGTYNVCTISLSYFDDKSYIFDDGIL